MSAIEPRPEPPPVAPPRPGKAEPIPPEMPNGTPGPEVEPPPMHPPAPPAPTA